MPAINVLLFLNIIIKKKNISLILLFSLVRFTKYTKFRLYVINSTNKNV